ATIVLRIPAVITALVQNRLAIHTLESFSRHFPAPVVGVEDPMNRRLLLQGWSARGVKVGQLQAVSVRIVFFLEAGITFGSKNRLAIHTVVGGHGLILARLVSHAPGMVTILMQNRFFVETVVT